ncbi:hypothetical protein H8356DRAFT_1698964 [Neocallimastix lanati (nom. inval.)]|jgi:hypothetical protein|uniref:DM10 domain-containing protein n=1 Tax=Neocallimastix californiae TaxID=1754190 RepID=A0A1Y2C1F6_9FUNG|nr:hypothetical protein H8356DRAFT_1698964 [Neocallimastix sp. JGI-2020a]ORY40860.1 hypothetical protein LY90DRAFT_704054 [Neocallimastix californiae]|eukprot:ORY40860.1 hypothetical protein LY90DRAFT_704054 [Neocallimastix californiae]
MEEKQTDDSTNKIQHLPFLPGNVFEDITKTDFRRSQSLWYNNGYMTSRNLKQGLGGDPLPVEAELSAEELLKEINNNPYIIYTHKNKEFCPYKKDGINGYNELLQVQNEPQPYKIPSYIAYDKMVLRFFGYYKESTYQSSEQYHLRQVVIYYYLEDNTMRVNEPQIENSGIPQGVLISRQKIPKSSSEFYTPKDLNIGINVQFYAKTIRIVDCDEFTKRYYKEVEKIDLNPAEKMPEDPYQLERNKPLRIKSDEPRNYPLKHFLENDRKVLRFYCVWDDRSNMFGDVHEFIIHYYLVDDCVEVREVHKQNDGRNPFPLLLKKQQLPKIFTDMNDIESSEKYHWSDFKIGSVINVLGRKCLIYDCDEYTRYYFMEHLGMTAEELKPYNVPREKSAEIPKQVIPQYNGFGSEEDSLGSVKYIVLQPPKKNIIKMLENDHIVLRFVAKMESKYKQNQDRRFILSYHVNDDKISIYEPMQRNSGIASGYFAKVFKKTAGITGGKYLESNYVKKPKEKAQEEDEEDIFNSQKSAEPVEYYTSKDLYVGAVININSQIFTLIDADEFVFNYMECKKDEYPMSNIKVILPKIMGKFSTDEKEDLKQKFPTTTIIKREDFIEAVSPLFLKYLTPHEIITLSRSCEGNDQKVDIDKVIKIINIL